MTTEELIKEIAERWANYAWNHPTKDNGFHVIMKDAILSALTELSQELVRERDEAQEKLSKAKDVSEVLTKAHDWIVEAKVVIAKAGDENRLLTQQLAEAVKERDEANKDYTMTCKAMKVVMDERDTLKTQLAEAVKDSQWLDWAIEHPNQFLSILQPPEGLAEARVDIDAAMNNTTKGTK